jgi:hypothetical protein
MNGDRVALLLAVNHPAERAGQGEADDEQQEDLNPVRPRVRVLERVSGVDVVEATAVGAELLDDFLARDRSAGDGLLAAGQRVDDLVVQVEVLDGTADDQDDREEHRDRQQDAERAADEVHPEVAEIAGAATGKASDQRHGDGHAHRCRNEVLHGEPCHLHQVTLGGFTRVGLPVGVRHEADGGVPRQPRRHLRSGIVQVKRELALDELEDEQDQNADCREGQHAAGIGAPGLFRLGVGADKAIDDALAARMFIGRINPVDVVAQRHMHCRERDDQRDEEHDPRCRSTH